MANYQSIRRNALIRLLSPKQWATIDARHGPRQPNGCILWTGPLNRDGRAVACGIHAARAVLYRQTGILGEVALHDCDNPRCVSLEPGHLRWGTQKENIRDTHRRGRAANRKGEANPNAKLTANDRATIRAAHTKGVSQKDLARQFNVHQTTISRVVRSAPASTAHTLQDA